MLNSDRVVFDPETNATRGAVSAPWKLLIADDDEEVHRVTKLALDGLTFDERPLQFIDAYSGSQTVDAMVSHPDMAIALVDVVMETDNAGLDAVTAIRSSLDNHFVRIVLRTGQPGQAPEREVLMRYDINDYKEKTELTATKLFTLVYAGLSQYRDMRELEAHRAGLEQVIGASAAIFEQRTPEHLATTVLQEFAALFDLDLAAHHPTDGGLAVAELDSGETAVVAATGRFANHGAEASARPLDPVVAARIATPPSFGHWHCEPEYFAAHLTARSGARHVFYLTGKAPLQPPGRQILDLFCANIAIALDNVLMNQRVEHTQSELVHMLSEAIERRSNETGHHVRRVGEYSHLLALLWGLDEEEAHVLRLAAPLHDAGKIAIPDAILNKPGPHTPEERVVMASHARIGAEMFKSRTLPVLKAATIVAAQHHERWDGGGYPHGLHGDDIHIYGRITALADVFDALGSRRSYKQAWTVESTVDLIREERGRHFDPRLVDLFLKHFDRFNEIRIRLADNVPAPA